MKIIWLGQAGLYIETAGKKILIDPYLSDCVAKVHPENARRVAVDESVFDIYPDVIICTHDHLDHTDPETLPCFLCRSGRITALIPSSAWDKVRKYGGGHNYVCFDRHSEWSEGDVRFIAVRAEHSDPKAIGVVIESEGKRLYVTGDTLYNKDVFDDVLPLGELDAVFLPINGVGNNMNMADAARFCEKLAAKTAVPMHWGLFDSLNGADWQYENKTVPEFFKEIKLGD